MAHFLKRLELNGFKSFAGKTVLEFPGGITAIVGPNGSGKSNVVDAVRWLLGEREAKNLRGAKVEDLIFAGTSKKPRMGQAQASLHFENKNNFFPVAFAEVSVMREIRRDGVSRYFLNKSEILLRDLIDFFAKARLGSKGLIVITQGNSDIFIQANPNGRREMIEEILGLREYQIKKNDAERRLKNSQINLDKVSALVEEILPHLRSLKRQTSRWEKREVLAEELKNLENQFFGSQLEEIKDKTKEVQKKIDAGKGELIVLEKEKKSAEARQAQVEASQPEGRRDMEKIKEQTQAILEQRSKLQKELGRIEVQLEMGRGSAIAPPAASAGKLAELVKRIKSKLESGIGKDVDELQRAVKEVLVEIESVLSSDTVKNDKSEISPTLKLQFDKVNSDLLVLEQELTDLKEKRRTWKKIRNNFIRHSRRQCLPSRRQKTASNAGKQGTANIYSKRKD